jgi:hypothetical protein
MKRLALLGAVVAAAAFAATPALASHAWGPYHWGRTSIAPFTIQTGDNVTSPWDGYVKTSALDWSADTNRNPVNSTVVAGRTDPKRCSPVAGTVQVCDARYGGGWLGQAQIWASGNHITQGTAKLNDRYYTPGSYYWTPAWMGMAACHEVGHTWGLGHQSESGADFHTCLDYANNPDGDNMHPNSHDYSQLALEYSHADSSSTIKTLATTSGASPVRVTRDDRISSSTVTELFADGSRRITHTHWAIPGAVR